MINAAKKVMVVAGEASGDELGAQLIKALHKLHPALKVVGLGGPAMAAQGVKSIFPLSEIAYMGIAEVVPHIPQILKRIDQVVDVARIEQIDLLITIDAPDFCLRVAKKVKAELKKPCIHYVSPHVWAWRAGRVHKMARYLDHVMALFPFEPPYYKDSGLACTYVGHPVAERMAQWQPADPYRKASTPPVLALAPGSRFSEISRMMAPFAETVALLRHDIPDLKVVLPVADTFNPRQFEPYVGLDAKFVRGDERLGALQQADAALATSGTVNLELAMLGLPMVVGYRLAPLTYWLAKRLVKLKHFSPVNLVAGGWAVPEVLQDKVNPKLLHKLMLPLLTDGPERRQQQEHLAKVRDLLGAQGPAPSARAAEVVSSYLKG